MTEPIVYRFEGIVAELDLVPLAGRRALDHAGVKVGLEAWRGLGPSARVAIVGLGSADNVDVRAVLEALAGASHTPFEGRSDPSVSAMPPEIAAAGLSAERWPQLRALDRWALASLASRGRAESLALLVAELTG